MYVGPDKLWLGDSINFTTTFTITNVVFASKRYYIKAMKKTLYWFTGIMAPAEAIQKKPKINEWHFYLPQWGKYGTISLLTRALSPLASLTTRNERRTRALLVINSIDCEQKRGIHFLRFILFSKQPTHYNYDYIECVEMMRRVFLFLVREAVLK